MNSVYSTQYNTESIGISWGKNLDLVPVHMKDLKVLSTFKNQIKKWMHKDCPWRLGKVYVVQVGFL